jgi:hypothetical protein
MGQMAVTTRVCVSGCFLRRHAGTIHAIVKLV